MHMALSDIVNEVIHLSRTAQEYWDRELPKRLANYPTVGEGEDPGPPPPEEARLEELLFGLPPDVVYNLALIMFLGRGDYSTDDLAGSYAAVQRYFEDPEQAVFRMIGIGGSLAYYLS
jgi:hypothetical protein